MVEEELWFVNTSSGPIGQFFNHIESHVDWDDSKKKDYVFSHLKGPAQKFSEENLNPEMDWKEIREKLYTQFRCHLTIREKVELRRHLVQSFNESIRDFFYRCISCQYFICDDLCEAVTDRDILINFLLGMRKDIYEDLIKGVNSIDLKTSLQEAEKIELIKNRCKIKIERNDEEYLVKEEYGDMDIYDAQEFNENNHVKVEIDEFNEEIQFDNEYYMGIVEEETPKVRQKRKYKKRDKSDKSPKKAKIKRIKTENDDDPDDPDVDPDQLSGYTKTQCPLCGEAFPKRMIDFHLARGHGTSKDGPVENIKDGKKTKLEKCKFCDVMLRGERVHKNHMKNFHPDKMLKCELCPDKRLSTKGITPEQSLELHKMMYHGEKDPDNSSKVFCSYCRQMGIEKSLEIQYLKHHIQRDHFQIRPHKCQVCSKSFLMMAELERHVEIVHIKSKTYECKHCKETFDSSGKYHYHLSTVHSTNSFVCDTCGLSCKTRVILNSHIQMHFERNCICDVCGSGFKTPAKLEDHKAVHMERTHKCTVPGCDKYFPRDKDMRRHVKKWHFKREKNYKCNQCTKEFYQPGQLLQHQRGVHLGLKDFKCDLCDFEAAYHNTLREHILTIHEGVMYRCDYPGCTKEMNRKGNLDAHKKSAHGILRINERNPPKKILLDE